LLLLLFFCSCNIWH